MELGKVTDQKEQKLNFFTVFLNDKTETIRFTRVPEEPIREFCNGLTDKKETWTKGILDPQIKNCGICLFDREKIVGIAYFFISEKYPPPTATVGIVIKPAYQDHGLGQKLLLLLEKIAHNYNITKFRAQIRMENPISLWVFHKCGYNITLIEEVEDRNNYILEKDISMYGKKMK